MTDTAFKRLWRGPRRPRGGGLLDPPSARRRYLDDKSLARYLRRPDAYPMGEHVLCGQIGHFESFRFILG